MRLFIAFKLPKDWCVELERRVRAVEDEFPAARWVRSENLHLSLLFLGETDSAQLGILHRAVSSTFERFAPLRFEPTRIGSFPPRKSARVIWLGVSWEGELIELQRDLTLEVAKVLGRPELRDERSFKPHLTLARCRKPWPQRTVKALADRFAAEGAIGKPYVCDRGVLFESELRPTGAVYRTQATFELRAT